MKSQWICIYTNFREENLASASLSKIGCRIYFPRYKKVINHARKKVEKILPLFPRYFFALKDKNFSLSDLNSARGLNKYISNEKGFPSSVDESVINFLKSREDSDGLIKINHKRFKTGDKIRITKGQFSSLYGIFSSENDEERAKIMMNFLGREHLLSINLNYLDRVVS
tara:strand:+ start:842 stop:1348 length:507 start_codon:yes stop_codon:yes gene_type:complete